MTRIIPPDAGEREQIEQELDKNFLVEAGAGSGKTSSLVKRMVSQIVTGKFRVGEIAAITFTRKAAAELKERFQTKLEETYRESEGPAAMFLERALAELDQGFLGTIHAFCARLLRERPVEAGLDPEFEELDELQEKLLVEKAWESFLTGAKLNRAGLLEQLEELGISPLELKSRFQLFSTYPDVTWVAQQVPRPDLRAPLDQVMALVEQAKKAIPPEEPEKGYDSLQKVILKAVRYQKYFDLTRDSNLVKILADFEKEAKVTQYKWASKDEAKQFRDEFNVLAAEVVAPALRAWREYCHYYLVDFLQEAVKHYEKLRDEVSCLNFQDLLMKAAAMLRNYPEVRRYFQGKYRSLLVDEFQDTDPIQAEIMFYLTGTDSREQDWQKLVPRPGSLFVVGDPKQSIYRFRRADIDTYNLAKELIRRSGGEVLRLTANFRSVKALGDWFNPVFRQLLPEKGTSYQAEFAFLDTVRPGPAGDTRPVRVLEIPKDYSKKSEIVEADADGIARYLKWSLDGNLLLARTPEEQEAGISEKCRPSDFMILLRYKDSMDVYARALEKYGVPVTMAGGSSLQESLELRELLKLLQALQDPDNPVYLVAVLRGLFFGLSDAALYRFKQAGGYFHIFGRVPEELDEVERDRFLEVYRRLQEYYRWTRAFTPSVALEKMITDLGLIPYTLSEPLGRSRCSYFYQVLEMLRQLETAGTISFNAMVQKYQVILETGLEEELDLTADEEAVRLMNLHKAKGLEAPVVFLAHPYKKLRAQAEQHIRRVGGKPRGYFFFTRPKGQYGVEVIGQPPDWDEYREEEQKYLEAEEARLLYVAATRAKNMLVISRSAADRNLGKNPWGPLLKEGPETAVLEVSETAAGQDKASLGEEITPEILETACRQLNGWQESLAVPGFSLVSPSKLQETSPQLEIKRQSGGGLAWGNVIHRVLEELVKGNPDLDTVITASLKENGLPLKREEEVCQFLDRFKQSLLWSQVQKADAKMAEVPFAVKIEAGHPLYEALKGENGVTVPFHGSGHGTAPDDRKGEKDVPVLLSGVIDLVLKEGNDWVVIDYKTDRVEDEKDLERLAETYAGQVFVYCRVWEELTGEKVKAGGIYFTGGDRLRFLI